MAKPSVMLNLEHIIRKDRCSVCRGEAKDWKCVQCAVVSAKHNPLHGCGSNKVQPKCVGCDRPEDLCTCKALGSKIITTLA